MFDAEIAVTLLNRWEGRQPAFHGHSSLDLLREGKLAFSRHIGNLWAVPVTGQSRLDIECLMFADGSCALRLWHTAEDSGWTRWAAMEPIHALSQTN